MHLEAQEREWTAAEIRDLIRGRLRPHFNTLAECHSTDELHAHPLYPELADTIHRVLESPEVEHFSHVEAPAKPSYRFLAWNLERGIELDGQIHEFRNHDYLKTCDVLLLTETDVGMARTGNRDVARTLAEELGFHYAFAPCYLNLAKGSGAEYEVDGENDLGLHGNAILSRYPMRHIRTVSLENGKDKMSGREKRLGTQSAVTAEIVFPNMTLHTASVHLDAHSTQRHRKEQLEAVLDGLPSSGPALVGGDWNTTTFNSSTAFHSIMGYWLRVMMGPGNVINNHYLHPYNRFEKELFAMLVERGFDYESANSMGEHTIYYEFGNTRTYKGLAEWVPQWCFPFIRWALRNHDGRCPLKLDWFAGRDLQVANPLVIHDLREGREVPLSDHDAIGLDVLAPPATD
jgi:endonuclease/exonuclease/phosphatase family metal-dependent hydrolase